jgi:hypothetical protein
MTLKRFPGAVVLLASITLVPSLSFAQQSEQKQRRDGAERKQEAGRAERAQPRREVAPPREVATPPRNEAAPARTEVRRDNGRSREGDVQRAVPRNEAVPRTEAPAQRGSRPSAIDPRVAPRSGYDRRDGYRTYDNSRRYEDRSRYSYAPRLNYGSRSYYRPYVFRPRFSIGFGIFSGYAVPYSYRYPYPITVFGYRAPVAPVIVGPGSPLYGGVSLEISPFDADVWVDGTWAGRVEDFDGTSQPLTLVPGTHRIEVQAPGYAPLVMDVVVQPGQVIPYRGDMQPY